MEPVGQRCTNRINVGQSHVSRNGTCTAFEVLSERSACEGSRKVNGPSGSSRWRSGRAVIYDDASDVSLMRVGAVVVQADLDSSVTSERRDVYIFCECGVADQRGVSPNGSPSQATIGAQLEVGVTVAVTSRVVSEVSSPAGFATDVSVGRSQAGKVHGRTNSTVISSVATGLILVDCFKSQCIVVPTST